jgi:hypothetical protein
MQQDHPRIDRRRALALALGCAAGSMLTSSVRSAAAQKLSQAQAEYQPTPKDIRSCGSCSLFLAPDQCKVVQGKISKLGWCKLYIAVD